MQFLRLDWYMGFGPDRVDATIGRTIDGPELRLRNA